jgi:hypothetical protein
MGVGPARTDTSERAGPKGATAKRQDKTQAMVRDGARIGVDALLGVDALPRVGVTPAAVIFLVATNVQR